MKTDQGLSTPGLPKKEVARTWAGTTESGGQPTQRAANNEELLRRLRTAASIIGTKLSWRRRRDLSLQVYRILKNIVVSDIAYRVARALTGVAPESWLIVSEAQAALAAMGVNVSRKFLYRRAGTARRAGDCTLEFVLNRERQWSGAKPILVSKPVVRLQVRCDGAMRFLVSPCEA
ncbi:MAG: hypothetical protein NTW87_11155 [Planctomycetota bacterium]|nr:hypothetical protein [Planctomycetota bacterium]